jgi:acetyltransferase
VPHKSDVGGVRLDIRDKTDLRGAATGIQQRLRESSRGARLEGFAVQPMVRRGHSIELLVGVSQDPAFGPVITFGAGGVAVEVTADVATGLPPLNLLLARDLISRTKVSRMLAGYRHVPAVAVDAIADVLLSVSSLVCRFPAIRGLEINPLLAAADGVLALDARILLDPANPQRDSRYRHLAIHPYPSEVEKIVTLKRVAQEPGQEPEPGAGEPDSPARRKVLLRPIQPDDAEREVAFFDGLSAQTRQWRFLHPIKSLTREMVARFTQVDYDRDMALVAVPLDENGTPRHEIVAVARYVRDADATRCEFAIVVGDEWQGCGLARPMLEHLIDHARLGGLQAMVGYVHPQNLRMLSFVRTMGFELSDSSEEPLKIAALQLRPAVPSHSLPSHSLTPTASREPR